MPKNENTEKKPLLKNTHSTNSAYQSIPTDGSHNHDTFRLRQITTGYSKGETSSSGSYAIYSQFPDIRYPEEGEFVTIPNQLDPNPDHPLLQVARSQNGLEYRPQGGDRTGSSLFRRIFTMPFSQRVDSGQVHISSDNGQPVILGPGRHHITSPLHSYGATVPFDDRARIDLHSTLKVVTVPVNQLQAAHCNNSNYVTLTQGRHVLVGAGWNVMNARNITDADIDLGRYRIVTISVGSIGAVNASGKTIPLAPGRHVIDNNHENFVGCVSLATSKYQLGNITGVRIAEGEMGLVYDAAGKLKLLPPGRHTVIAPEETFVDFISMRQQIIKLPEMVVATKDNVRIKINSDVIYQIHDAVTALKQIGLSSADKNIHQNIQQAIIERAEMLLNQIFKHHLFSEMRQTSMREEGSVAKSLAKGKGKEREDADVDGFSERITDELQQQLSSNLGALGVTLITLGTPTLVLEDVALQKTLTDQAALVAKSAAELDALRYQNLTATQRAETDAKTKTITVEVEVRTNMAKVTGAAKAEAEIAQIKAAAEAQARVIKATSEADAIRIAAQADKDARLLRAEGDTAQAMVLEANPTFAKIATIDAEGRALGNALNRAQNPVIFARGNFEDGFGLFRTPQAQVIQNRLDVAENSSGKRTLSEASSAMFSHVSEQSRVQAQLATVASNANDSSMENTY